MKLRSTDENWLRRMERRGEEMGFRRCTWFEYFFRNWFSR
jgi:hypothetical protein